MKRKFNRIIISLIVLSLVVLPSFASAQIGDVEPQDIGNPLYPGTNIEMYPGDVLYSPKSWSTIWVGHVAIVGTDFKIYHSHPQSPYKFADTMDTYMSRHNSGDKIEVLRASNYSLDENAAAEWAMNNLSKIKTYDVYASKLNNIADNYCSKYIWQAFYYSNNHDIIGQNLTDQDSETIFPSEIKNSDDFSVSTYFIVE
jgi:uncharacterized protein YycO